MQSTRLGPRTLIRRAVAVFCALLFAVAASAQSFQQPTVIPTSNWPAYVGTADMNHDGNPDLIYLDPLNPTGRTTFHWMAGDGHGKFTPQPQGDSFWFGSSVVFGDFLGLGVQQISNAYNAGPGPFIGLKCPVAGIGFPISAYDSTGNGLGAYGTVICSTGPKQPVIGSVVSATLRKGLSPTLVFTDSANDLLYLVTFTTSIGFGRTVDVHPSVTTVPLADGAVQVVALDLNGDGKLDLVVAGDVATNVFLGNGDGTLQAPRRFVGASPIHSLLLQDVNNDGRPDLIAESLNGHIDVFPGNGDGTFSTTSIGGTGPLDGLTGNGGHLIAIADLNHDGQLDALTATPAGISTLLGAGTSYLKLGGIYNAGPGHTSYAVADFNGDGNLDLAVDSPEGIAILYGNPDGSFQTSRAYAAGAPALSAASGVFTASGKIDFVASTAATQGQLLRGAGDGTFAYNGSPGAPVPTTARTGTAGLWSVLQAADFNGDGHLDLLFTADGSNQNLPQVGSAKGIYIQRGDGAGNFADPVAAVADLQFIYPPSSSCTPPFNHFPGQFFGTSVVADFNSDGLPDFASRDAGAYRIMRGNNGSASSSYSQDPTLYWSGVDGTGNTVDCNAHAHDLVATGDFNNDGIPDVLFQGSLGNSGALQLYLSGPQRTLPAAGDLSVDGSLTTPGQLTAPQINPVFGGISSTFHEPYFPGAIASADLDSDGNLDLLVTYANLSAAVANPSSTAPNYLYVWFGSGGGKFLTSPAHPVNPVRLQLSRNFYQVAVADLNKDGIPDLILSDGYLISYQLGLGDGTFGPENHILAGQGINTISTADLRGTGVNDLVIANGGAALSNPVVNHEVLAADPDVNTGGITVLLNTVTPRNPAPTLTASPEPSVFFSPYTLTADETSNGGPGNVDFFQDATLLGSAATVNGIATYPVPAGNEYLPGAHALTAHFTPSGSNNAYQLLTGTHTITRAPTTVTLTPTTPLTVFYGQGIDGTFSVGVVDGKYPGNGNYTLLDNGAPVAICTNIPTAQSCPYGNPVLLDAGPHTLSIQYLGDPVNAPSTSPGYAFTILPDLTTLSLTSSLSPAYLGQTVTYTAIATGNIVTPTGAVAFSDGGQINQGQALAGGSASIAVTALFTGTHNVSARYPGNLDFNPATSNTVPQLILPDLTAVILTSSKNPANLGDAVTFTATVTGNYLPPAGAVNFLDAGVVLGSGQLTAGNRLSSGVTYTTSSLTVGTHPLTVQFVGNIDFDPATSAILNQVIQALPVVSQPSITTLTSNLNPSAPRQLVTFTTQVQVPGVFITVPTGTVTFLEGTTTLGTGTLNRYGVATFQTAALATGTHPLTATYAGALIPGVQAIQPSTSAVLNQVVTLAIDPSGTGFLMNVTPGSLTVGVGRTGLLTVSILATGGFNQPVALSCSNLAPETSCTFSPSATVPPGGGNITLQLATNAPRDCNTNQPYFLGSTSTPKWPFGIAAAGLCLIALRRRRFKSILAVAAAITLTSLSGCGHCTDLGTRPGNYSFTLTGIAQGGPVTQTRTVNIPLTMTIPGS